MRGIGSVLFALGLLASAVPAVADVVPRGQPAAGSVISRKSGEEVQFIDVSGWRAVDAKQDLLAGDLLRTNAFGHLAVLFADRTQIRLGRNTMLLVKEIGEAADSRFELSSGTIWARAERGGVGLTVDTPAAAAAIRGTDWTMTVDASGRTSLIVLEGLVELSNEFGSVSVAEGEAAAASIGQAPTKIVIVDPKDREQMLFFLSLRNAFHALPVSPLPSPRMREARARIEAIPAKARSAEDRVLLAEVAFSYDGRQRAAKAVAAARAVPLDAGQKARLDLIEAMIAGAEKRYDEAARLFERSRRRLDPRRRAIAAYGGYFARALADPDRIERPPALGDAGPYGAIAAALTAGFLEDIPAAIEVLKAAERGYPGDSSLPAVRAQFAILIDDREQVEEAIERALAIDPNDPTALEARSLYRAGYKGDIEGAYADIARAAEIAPGSTTIWNQLGNIQSVRGAAREAEAAFLRAIELDPEDPASRANLAILYLDQSRLKEAKAAIDAAMALDPSFDIALVALGRYYLQSGEVDKGVETLLAGSTANPGSSQALLLLAAGYYESGQREPAEQALENADRLDPNDPVTSIFETSIAIDDYDSARAIESAQEAMKRARARGGDFAPASANRDAGSALNEAFRMQGLDAWGRYYGDLTFDPFAGASYIDQTVSGSANPFRNDLDFRRTAVEPEAPDSAFSTFFQGILLEPLSISGRSRSANLFRRPFLEGSLGGGFVHEGGEWNWNGEMEVQGHAAGPVPWSVLADIKGLESDTLREFTADGAIFPTIRGDFETRNLSAFGFLTAQPTPHDRIVAFVNASNDDDVIDGLRVIPFPLNPALTVAQYDRDLDMRSAVASLGWSHTFGYRNVANIAGFFVGKTGSQDESTVAFGDLGVLGDRLFPGVDGILADVSQTRNSTTGLLAAANHLIGIGDLTLRYGAEAGGYRSRTSTVRERGYFTAAADPLGSFLVNDAASVDFATARAYADVLYDARDDLTFEAGAFVSHIGLPGDETTRLDPRAGVAWSPLDGHWLRAGYIRDTPFLNAATLAPVGIVGLHPNRIGFAATGYSDTFAGRWDAEWNDRFFTSLDVQHQKLHDMSLDAPLGLASIALARGEITRASGTANLYLGNGFGLFATGVYTDSRNDTPGSAGFGGPLPFIPEISGRAGLTFVHPSNLKATIAATYVGERRDSGAAALSDYWTVDAFLTWEPFDKRFAFELAGYNLLDETFLVDANTPGWGQTFTGSFKIRF